MRIKVLFVTLITVVGITWGVVSDAAPALEGQSSRPEMSTYALGEPVELTFTAMGLKPGQADQELILRIEDAFGKTRTELRHPFVADETGRAQVKLTPPADRLGFYRVHAKLSDGTTLPKLGSRSAGYMTYCVVPDPNQRELYPSDETFFGMQGGFTRTVQVLPYLGVRWVLGNLEWRHFEKAGPGTFAKKIVEAESRGEVYPEDGWTWPTMTAPDGTTVPWTVYTLPTLYSVKGMNWVWIPETYAYCTGALKPEAEEPWVEYCRAAVRAFMAQQPDMAERIYQMTWEPVYPWGFKGTDEQLIRIYELAYPVIHEEDPKAVVVGPTFSSSDDLAAQRRLFERGLARLVDGYSVHPYKAVPPESHGLLSFCRKLKQMLLDTRGVETPMYGTEVGWATGDDPAKEILQALGMTRLNLILLGEGFRANLSFYSTDFYSEPGYGFYYNLDPNTSFGSAKTSPKPVAPAFAAMTFLLEGKRPVEAIEWMGETALGYVYQRGDDVVLALWDYGDEPTPVTLPVGVDTVELYDWMGNRSTVQCKDQRLDLELTPAPVYVKGVSLDLWGKDAKKAITIAEKQVNTVPGDEPEAVFSVAPVKAEPLRGTLIVEPAESLNIGVLRRKIAVNPGQTIEEAFKLPVDVGTPLGMYPVKVRLESDGETVAADGLVVQVEAPLTVANVQPTRSASGGPALSFEAEALADRPFSGTAALRMKGLPDMPDPTEIELEAGERERFVLDLSGTSPQPTRNYTAMLTLRSREGAEFEHAASVAFLRAQRTEKPMGLSGEASDWSGFAPYPVRGRDMLIRSPQYYEGDHDLNAAFKVAYDDEALYMAVLVVDDRHMQENTGFMTWKGDAVHLGINMDHGQEVTETGNILEEQGSRHRTMEIVFAATAEGPEAYRVNTFDIDAYPVRALTTDEARLYVHRPEEGRWVYELAVPWATLGARVSEGPPASGSVIGIALNVNDMDNAEQRDPSALAVFDGIASTKDASLYGSLLLD